MTTLGDITALKVEQSGPPMTGEFTYVDISSIDNRAKRIIEPKRLPVDAAPSRARQRLSAGDVLVSMTRPNLNAVALVPSELDGAIGSTGFHVLRANESTEPRWLYYAVQNRSFVQAMSEVVQGALYPAVRPKDIRGFEVDPPPLSAQRRIVAEIEKQFSRLDEAVAGLQRVKSNLKRYKAAVLKAAVEGRLVSTEADLARREGRSFETGAQLLQRILATRRSQWQGKGKYKESAAPETTDLPELPEGWVWTSASQVLLEVKDGTHETPTYQESGIPFITQKHVKAAGFVFDDYSFISQQDHDRFYQRSDPERGDILVSMIGVNRGESCVINVSDTFSIKNVGLMKPNRALTSGKFIQYYLSSPVGSRLLLAKSKGGAQPFVGLSELRAWPIALPPLHEQHRIVAEVDRLLSIAREAEAEVEANLKRAQGLRQAILQTAFSSASPERQ